MPVFLKRDLTEQLPYLKKKNLTFGEYAKKSIRDLFGKEAMKKARVEEFNYAPSCIAINNGQGKFEIQILPVPAQLSSINAILSTDINKDGKMDLVMGGNEFYFQPQFSRLDASYGHILINKGIENGKILWEWQEPSLTGFETRGEVKNIFLIPTPKENNLLVLQNDTYPVLFRIKH